LRPFLSSGFAQAAQRAGLVARWGAAVVLAASALQLIIAPRADQPLLDALEYVAPPFRSAYLNAAEAATYGDARQYADRYLLETEQLNALEMRSRAEGESLDDTAVRRISSFLKSYGEMRRGEQFVMQEVRGRARERIRWPLGVGMLFAAVALAPGLMMGIRRTVARRG
jgi:zinc/manganese transport system permease protein